MRTTWALACIRSAAALALCLSLAGCVAGNSSAGGSTDSGDDEDPGERVTVPDPMIPAVRFDASATEVLRDNASEDEESPPAPVALDGQTVYYTTEQALYAYDVLSGEERWDVWPDEQAGASSEDRATHGAALLETEDGALVVGAFETQAPEEGTSRGGPQLEVLAVDADSGEQRWHTAHLPETDLTLPPHALGADGGQVIVRHNGTQALDVDTGEVTWTDPDLRPHLVQDGVVIGETGEFPSQLRAISAETGEELWTAWDHGGEQSFSEADAEFRDRVDDDTSPEERVAVYADVYGLVLPHTAEDPARTAVLYPAGEGTFAALAGRVTEDVYVNMAGGRPPQAESGEILLIDVATGAIERSIRPVTGTGPAGDEYRWGDADCGHDGVDTLVCWENTSGRSTAARTVVAVDVDSGDTRWTEDYGPGGSRTAIDPRGVWQGALYATTDGQGVVLDVADGSDLETAPDAAPDLTNGIVAVGYGPGQRLTVYPVTG